MYSVHGKKEVIEVVLHLCKLFDLGQALLVRAQRWAVGHKPNAHKRVRVMQGHS
jgi:hypothetical protein